MWTTSTSASPKIVQARDIPWTIQAATQMTRLLGGRAENSEHVHPGPQETLHMNGSDEPGPHNSSA